MNVIMSLITFESLTTCTLAVQLDVRINVELVLHIYGNIYPNILSQKSAKNKENRLRYCFLSLWKEFLEQDDIQITKFRYLCRDLQEKPVIQGN